MPQTTNDIRTRLRTTIPILEQNVGVGSPLNPPTRAVQTELLKIYQGVRHIVEDAAVSIDAAQKDPRYTGEGVKDRMAVIAQEGRASLEFIVQMIKTYGEKAEELAKLLTTGKTALAGDVADRIIRELRAQEIRAALKGKPSLELGSIFMKAVADGDETLVLAMKADPMGSKVPADILHQLEEQQQRSVSPEAFERLQALREAKQQLELLWAQLLDWLRGLGAQVERTERVIVKAG